MWRREFIIQQSVTSRRKLIQATSFQQLLKAACKEFKIQEDGAQIVLEDGTEISDDDYLRTRPPLTLLILLQRDELEKYLEERTESAIQQFCDAWARRNDGQLKRLRKLFENESLQRILIRLESEREEDARDRVRLTSCDSRKGHSEWFEGLPEGKHSKKEVMSSSAMCRIKGYYYKTKDDLRGLPAAELLLREIQDLLRVNSYHSDIFSRGEKGALCCREGRFTCRGSYDLQKCGKGHTINPYSSSHRRVMFGTWNLDHQIERSREIIPAIIEAAQSLPPKKVLNTKYFYSLLFTTGNLRLVHLVCHKKGKHVGRRCDRSFYYVSPNQA